MISRNYFNKNQLITKLESIIIVLAAMILGSLIVLIPLAGVK